MSFLLYRNPKSQITSGLNGTVLLRALPNATLHRNGAGAVSLPRPIVHPRTKSPNGPGNLQFLCFLRLSLLKPGGIRGKCNPYVPESFTLKS